MLSLCDDQLCNLNEDISFAQHVANARKRFPSHCSRLIEASKDDNFVFATMYCEFKSIDCQIAVDIIGILMKKRDENDVTFGIQSSTKRLKTHLNVPLATAKSLLASVCQLNTGNELQQFVNLMPAYLEAMRATFTAFVINQSYFEPLIEDTRNTIINNSWMKLFNVRFENDPAVSKMM